MLLAFVSTVGIAANSKSSTGGKDKTYYLLNETKLCIILDFKNARINKLPYEAWNDVDGDKIIQRWTRSVISFFNQKQDLIAPIDCVNTGEKYDLLIKITKVDPDGETYGKIFLKNHISGDVMVSDDINANGEDEDDGFEQAWNETSEKFAKKIVKFISKYTGTDKKKK